MSKVYVVTDGVYSDYQILGVCSTEENAKRYIDAVCRERWFVDGEPPNCWVHAPRIEEYEMDGWLDVFDHLNGKVWFYVSRYENWSDFCVDRVESDGYGRMSEGKGLELLEGDGMWWFGGPVLADDERGAVKIAAEQLTMALAHREGLA